MAARRDNLGSFPARLAILLAIAALATGALAAQVVRLAIVEHGEHAARTAQALRRTGWLPFVRGSILDRRGEPLAVDAASWDLRVEYGTISGRHAVWRATERARRAAGPTAWASLGEDGRRAAIERELPGCEAEVERVLAAICEAGGFDRDELARRFDRIVRTVAARADALRELRREAAARKALETGLPPEPVPEDEPIREQSESHLVLADLDDATALRLASLSEREPGLFEVVPATRRVRPWREVELEIVRDGLPGPLRSPTPLSVRLVGVADHLLGTTRTAVHREDLERRPFRDAETGEVVDPGGYLADRDVVGSSGLERMLEDRLRGRRGRLDRDLERGTVERIESERGEDVRLTLDIRLQARVQAALDSRLGLAAVQPWQWGSEVPSLPLGRPLAGAAAVIEIDTGDILALVSSPTLAGSGGASSIDRAIAGSYPPGSIVKPLVLAAAITEGEASPETVIECTGHFFPKVTTNTRCWIWRPDRGRDLTHGPLGGPEAIARSCNIYFYELARGLGLARTVGWFRRFGMGEVPGIGFARESDRDGDGRIEIEGEAAGSVPDPEGPLAGSASATAAIGIGQGPLLWSPLQAAQAYATLARGGEVIGPSILLDRADRGRIRERIGLDPRGVEVALAGLRDAVERPYGTGHHLTFADQTREGLFAIPGVRVWGKTGTAEAPPLGFDEDGDGTIDRRVDVDHSWFVGLVGPAAANRPQYALAVLLEHGGSGGKAAGPIAAEVVRALVAEGYLRPGGGR
jgi:penicillin-binding protein 2